MVKPLNTSPSPEPKPPNAWRKWRWFLLIISGCIALMASLAASDDFLVWKDGLPTLAPWRKAKLERELAKIEQAEQYVLKADVAGYFPCFNCYDKPHVYLNAGEIWKYGVTMNGEKGRYKSGLPTERLVYLVEYEGPLNKCLKLEKTKIYNYALLPENTRRERPLMRPPGNKRDN
jgi:hypothetical protein